MNPQQAGTCYEIVIAGWGGGTCTAIRTGIDSPHLEVVSVKHPRGMVGLGEFSAWWVSVDTRDGRVAFGDGADISAQPILEFFDPQVMEPTA